MACPTPGARLYGARGRARAAHSTGGCSRQARVASARGEHRRRRAAEGASRRVTAISRLCSQIDRQVSYNECRRCEQASGDDDHVRFGQRPPHVRVTAVAGLFCSAKYPVQISQQRPDCEAAPSGPHWRVRAFACPCRSQPSGFRPGASRGALPFATFTGSLAKAACGLHRMGACYMCTSSCSTPAGSGCVRLGTAQVQRRTTQGDLSRAAWRQGERNVAGEEFVAGRVCACFAQKPCRPLLDSNSPQHALHYTHCRVRDSVHKEPKLGWHSANVRSVTEYTEH